MFQPRSLPQSVNKSFAELPVPSRPRSTFGLGTKHTTTANASKLFPIYWEETLPADTHSIQVRLFGRLLTSVNPVMDNMHLDWHAFHCPNRLVWDNWQKFMGERINPSDSIDYVCPVLWEDAADWGFQRMGIADYMGIPTLPVTMPEQADDPNLPNAFVHRSIWTIWNEWYRDQNLQNSFTVPVGDGPDDPNAVSINGYKLDDLPPRNKRHSYITSALPWPQKGDAVSISIGGTAPVHGNEKIINFVRGTSGAGGFGIGVTSGDPALRGAFTAGIQSGAPGSAFTASTASSSVYLGLHPNPDYSGMVADLSNATAITVNQWREAIALQQMLEADARSGTRYVEILLSQFGVVVPDFRVQRPEFLGGGSTLIDMNAVSNTASDTGDLTGVATVGINDHFVYSAVEHGHIIILASVRVDLRFQNMMDRRLTRRTRYDFYREEMAHLGEQAIKNREVFFTTGGSPAVGQINDDIFGYQERFGEYRYREPMVTGFMRSNDPLSLDQWHYALDYSDLPNLNAAFIQDESEVAIRRTVLDQTGPLFRIDIDIENRCTRVLPVEAIPGLLRL